MSDLGKLWIGILENSIDWKIDFNEKYLAIFNKFNDDHYLKISASGEDFVDMTIITASNDVIKIEGLNVVEKFEFINQIIRLFVNGNIY